MTQLIVPLGVIGVLIWAFAGWVLYWRREGAEPQALEEATRANREAAEEMQATVAELRDLLENLNTTLLLSHLAEDTGPADLSELDRRATELLSRARTEQAQAVKGDD